MLEKGWRQLHAQERDTGTNLAITGTPLLTQGVCGTIAHERLHWVELLVLGRCERPPARNTAADHRSASLQCSSVHYVSTETKTRSLSCAQILDEMTATAAVCYIYAELTWEDTAQNSLPCIPGVG